MPRRLEFEPIPREALPKDLRHFPDIWAMETYAYRSVRRGPARIFYKDYEDSRRAEMGKQHVAFRVHDIVLFFATAAGSGVIGNLAYAALVSIINRIRRPRKEVGGDNLRLEAVVSRQSYNRLRRKYHPDEKASRQREEAVERKLQTQYKLIVKLKRD
jgi:hypothetical protein